ncbi:MAG TPA: oxygen-independent coproporphyrinogen III oxidase [Woeseiaceae bacterium]|nr:oxygen-independent coproporphyrinogen III oxidase [Woeseiaceae bacterium]
MNATAIFDHNLVRRHDRPGPRYTSYPTAPQFSESFGERELRSFAEQSNLRPVPRPLSIYVHVPYCFSPCFYCGCNRVITRDLGKGETYLDRLLLEVERTSSLFNHDREVMQVHLGGGTPNFLRPAQLARLVDGLGQHYLFGDSRQRDFSIELDPRHIEDGDIQELAGIGFNRASLGVQDFDADVQKAVNRVQGVEETLAVVDACRNSGFRSVNVDLIYGLPRQTIDGFLQTLVTVIEAWPDRLAIYGYAHLPRMFKAQRQINEIELPDAVERLLLLQLAVEMLTDAGYQYIGMDHFALPDDDLATAQLAGSLHRNFMGYTTHADCDLIGLGVSAISHIGDSFSQNPRDLAGWECAVDAGRIPVWRGLALSFDDILRADVIQQLMCHGEIDTKDIEHRYDIEFPRYFSATLPMLELLADDGLIELRGDRITASSRGRYLLRTIAMCFDKYVDHLQIADDTPRYSRTI